MSTRSTQESTHFERLRADYKGAFDEWALEVGRLQAVSSAPGDTVTEQAQERVTAAETAYRSSRNRLTDDLGLTRSNVAG